ncbi:hypothetical protein NA78x_000800 [Anatilimnocola sp. NA78]|uniref:hypothetical protein n=1 Tax=Anatilimnocola sp. NA78 TaxID=3415683 RepID=UPI003CE49123
MIRQSAVAAQLASFAFAIVATSFIVGCGGDKVAHVSGKVTFNGKPVPAGKVIIKPDSAKGNSGATGFADIKDGAYDTKVAGGKGAPPGPVVFTVEGIDPVPPPNASPDVTTTVLFPYYEMTAEVAAAGGVHDIDVPAEAAKGPPPPKVKPGVQP